MLTMGDFGTSGEHVYVWLYTRCGCFQNEIFTPETVCNIFLPSILTALRVSIHRFRRSRHNVENPFIATTSVPICVSSNALCNFVKTVKCRAERDLANKDGGVVTLAFDFRPQFFDTTVVRTEKCDRAARKHAGSCDVTSIIPPYAHRSTDGNSPYRTSGEFRWKRVNNRGRPILFAVRRG